MRRKVATPLPPKETFWWKKKGKKREKHFCTDVFDNTCHIDHFKAYIFCPQTTQEPPKKHNEGGLPGHLPTDALSQIGYRHTRHCKDCLSQRRTPFQNVSPPLFMYTFIYMFMLLVWNAMSKTFSFYLTNSPSRGELDDKDITTVCTWKTNILHSNSALVMCKTLKKEDRAFRNIGKGI